MIIVKNRFRLVPYRSLGVMYYLHDNQTGKRASLETKDEDRAIELLVHHGGNSSVGKSSGVIGESPKRLFRSV